MTEIEKQFREELQELIDRYKDQLTNPQIMSIAQPIFTKTIGFKDNPDRLNLAKKHILHEGSLGRDAVAGIEDKAVRDLVYKGHCSSQEIAEADCDGDIRHCKNACGKLRMNKTTISDYQGADREIDIEELYNGSIRY